MNNVELWDAVVEINDFATKVSHPHIGALNVEIDRLLEHINVHTREDAEKRDQPPISSEDKEVWRKEAQKAVIADIEDVGVEGRVQAARVLDLLIELENKEAKLLELKSNPLHHVVMQGAAGGGGSSGVSANIPSGGMRRPISGGSSIHHPSIVQKPIPPTLLRPLNPEMTSEQAKKRLRRWYVEKYQKKDVAD